LQNPTGTAEEPLRSVDVDVAATAFLNPFSSTLESDRKRSGRYYESWETSRRGKVPEQISNHQNSIIIHQDLTRRKLPPRYDSLLTAGSVRNALRARS
jgi:hypothetical protein